MTDRVKLAERLKALIAGDAVYDTQTIREAAALLSAPVEEEVAQLKYKLIYFAVNPQRYSDHELMLDAAALLTRLDLRLKTVEAETIERCAAIADAARKNQASLREYYRVRNDEDSMDRAAASARCASNIAASIRSLSPIKQTQESER